MTNKRKNPSTGHVRERKPTKTKVPHKPTTEGREECNNPDNTPARNSTRRTLILAVFVLVLVAVFAWNISLGTRRPTMDSSMEDCTPVNDEVVERRSNLSLDEFIRCYDGKRPVLITDVLPSWGAMNWSKSFFQKNYGDKRIVLKGVEGSLKNAATFAAPLSMFAAHSHEGMPERWSYLEDELFIQSNPQLKKDLDEPIYLKEDFFQLFPSEVRPWNAMLLWGTKYSRSSLHIDPYNWTGTNAVFSGKKMWKMFAPGQDEYLYVKRGQKSGFPLDCFKYNSPIDAFEPDYKQYPLFKKARAMSFTQQPGELLIIPTGWFHQAFNAEETIAVSSQVMNSQNYVIVLEEILKVDNVDKTKLPKHFNALSPVDQIQTVMTLLPKHIIERGREVTKNIEAQTQRQAKKG